MTQKLGQILLRNGHVTSEVLDQAVERSRSEKRRLGEVLISCFGVNSTNVYSALAQQFSLPFIGNIETHVNQALVTELPSELFSEGKCMPIGSSESSAAIVVHDPTDLGIVLDINRATGLAVETSVTTPDEIEEARRRLFEGESSFRRSMSRVARDYERQMHNDSSAMTLDEIRKRTESEPVVRMASLIFEESIDRGASDIHIEPGELGAQVRLRVDGMLRHHMDLSRSMYVPVTSRIKILADLDIAEKRVPQDGRIRYDFKNSVYDFRVSTLPTHHGEKTVIRILKHDRALLELENLGIAGHEIAQLETLIHKPQGMIFVTGPTGSGKSSSLFACLNRIRNKEINITTIENPIEYKLEGVNQVQINEKAGVTFAGTLRSILRQDPDVILIGEIRDRETAEIAMQASQTGHLVFSTLHTNDSVSAVTRLRDLGVPGYLVSSSLLAIIAQRLVRVLCPSCRRPTEISTELQQRWRATFGDIPLPRPHEAPGCDNCKESGFKGRTGIYEIVLVNEEIRSLISEETTENTLRRRLRDLGMKTLMENGIDKVKEGITTPDELLRVVLIDDVVY